MSQMPDKIWLHKDTKYNTGDVVCGYQYEFAEGIEDEGGIENFVEYVPVDAFIDKAWEWLIAHILDYTIYEPYWGGIVVNNDLFSAFKKAMKGE